MRKYKLYLFSFIILILLSFLVYERLESNIGTTNIVETINNDTQKYQLSVSFELDGIVKARDVQLYILRNHNTFEGLPITYSNDKYQLENTEFSFSQQEMDDYFKNKKPDILVTWKIGNKINSEIIR